MLDVKLLLTVFATVFLAELGDKTQLATMLYATRETAGLLTVFAGASLALIAASGLAVAAGSALSNVIEPRYLSWVAGTGFILIGVWTLARA